ncbi:MULTISPECIES: hypothetical protein [unclassified Streptomyces]
MLELPCPAPVTGWGTAGPGLRYRPAARQGESEDISTCHLGFRCI